MKPNDYSEDYDENEDLEDEMMEDDNPYVINEVDETDEDTEYGDNPAWDW